MPTSLRRAIKPPDLIEDMAAERPAYWLTFFGRAGTGKTFLARQILEESRKFNPGRHSLWVPPGNPVGTLQESQRRPYCIWIDATRFSERLKGGEYNLPESYATDWCVVFDDLGASRDKTDYVPEAIYRFAASRLGKWTVWTTNLTPDEVANRLDQWLTSRLFRDDNRGGGAQMGWRLRPFRPSKWSAIIRFADRRRRPHLTPHLQAQLAGNYPRSA